MRAITAQIAINGTNARALKMGMIGKNKPKTLKVIPNGVELLNAFVESMNIFNMCSNQT